MLVHCWRQRWQPASPCINAQMLYTSRLEKERWTTRISLRVGIHTLCVNAEVVLSTLAGVHPSVCLWTDLVAAISPQQYKAPQNFTGVGVVYIKNEGRVQRRVRPDPVNPEYSCDDALILMVVYITSEYAGDWNVIVDRGVAKWQLMKLLMQHVWSVQLQQH